MASIMERLRGAVIIETMPGSEDFPGITWGDFTKMIDFLDGVKTGDLKMQAGTIIEGTERLGEIEAEVTKRSTSYILGAFLRNKEGCDILVAKIKKRPLDVVEAFFMGGDEIVTTEISGARLDIGDCIAYRKDPHLNSNQTVDIETGTFIEAEYLAIYREGRWCAYHPEDRKLLDRGSVEVSERWSPIPTELFSSY
jgi:hypothetical protein